MIEAVAERAASTDPLALLETAITYAALVGTGADAMVDHYVEAARAAGLSWADLGDRLGVLKQAAGQRFATRLVVRGGTATEPAPLAPRLATCVQSAQETADADDSLPSSHHLLLGLLHVGMAAGVLDRLGVTRSSAGYVTFRR